MRKFYKNSLLTVLIVLMALATVSCKKKEVKKIAVDNQFAVALFSDTISLLDIINDMDSTTKTWIRVRNDSLFAYYYDSIKDVLRASDFLSALPNMQYATHTYFTMPEYDPTNNHDTVIDNNCFMTVPFNYDGFHITDVELCSGAMEFGFEVNPPIEHLRSIEIYSDCIVDEEGHPFLMTIDNDHSHQILDLTNYHIVPVNDTVVFGGRVAIHIDEGVYPGGEYECNLEGSLSAVNFKTVNAVVTKAIDSVYRDYAEIDFGINGIGGSAHFPVPKITLTYSNSFGLGATTDVTKLNFVNGVSGLVTNLLAADHWIETIEPTGGLYKRKRIGNFVDKIDVLAGYTYIEFDGEVSIAQPGDTISISNYSTVDVVADVEMPMSFDISDLHYTDTVALDFGTNDELSMDEYFDEIDLFINYSNHIPLNVKMQGIFLKDGQVTDSLFTDGGAFLYNEDGQIECVVTEERLQNLLRSNQMVLRFGVSTQFNNVLETVMLRVTDNIAVKMKMLTKTSEINIDNF